MSIATQSTETLFLNWRRGDESAGNAMAQRFTDWYFAIAACRLGETDGEPAFREACTAFSRGVMRVAEPRRLLGWAHGIVREQIHTASGGRRAMGDPPNNWTRHNPPRQLLLHARAAIPDVMAILEPGYRDGRVDDPQRLLAARYALKRWLRERFEIPFRVLPQKPDPDRAPLAFYESGHMTDDHEQTHFELYLLTEMEVCQDVAEFAHYAIALRGGLPGDAPPVRAVDPEAATLPAVAPPTLADARPPKAAPAKAAPAAPAAPLPAYVWGVVGVAGVLLVALAALYLFLA